MNAAALTASDEAGQEGWLTAGVAGIGTASLLADLGHEVPTALLPSFLTSTLGAPAAALGVIEGVSDGLAGVARLGGGALADDPARRRTIAVGGYTSTAVLAGLIGIASSVWQVGLLRAGAWTARGLRVPARNALLADVVPREVYGRAYGFERAIDNLGAIGGALIALGLVGSIGVRSAILVDHPRPAGRAGDHLRHPPRPTATAARAPTRPAAPPPATPRPARPLRACPGRSTRRSLACLARPIRHLKLWLRCRSKGTDREVDANWAGSTV